MSDRVQHFEKGALSRLACLALLACLMGSGALGEDSLPPALRRRWYVETSRDSRSSPGGSEESIRRVLDVYPGPEHRQESASMCWTEEEVPANVGGGIQDVSVIVVEFRRHNSNHFRDKERVRAYGSRVEGSTNAVVSVQFASPFPNGTLEDSGGAPFGVSHPERVDKRVRIVHIADADYFGPLDEVQLQHLTAACEDPSETTVVAIVDETCRWRLRERNLPAACLTNVVRTYPFNVARDNEEYRTAYLPLGPRDSFPFIAPDLRRPASLRPTLFNLLIRARESARRKGVITIAQQYRAANPDMNCLPGDGIVDEAEFRAILLNSKFTLSPAGHNAECFRTWEALEAGSIPIISKLDFTNQEYTLPKGHNCGVGSVAWNTVAGSPFAKEVSVANWRELPALLDRLRREPDDYTDKLQADSVAWYESVMKQMYRSLLSVGGPDDMFPQDGPIVDSALWNSSQTKDTLIQLGAC